jgi:branched-chain amino acid transport system substrate-binding protein
MTSIVKCLAVAFGAVLAATAAARADTIKIGVLAEITCPDGAPCPVVDGLNGARLAVEDINKAGGVLSRPIELVVEDLHEVGDRQTMQANAVAAFTKLAAQPDIAAFIGPDYSLLIHPLAPEVMKVGKPMMIGGTDPKLTHMGNSWLFRCRPNDIYSTKAMAAFGVNTLQRKRWAIAHLNDPYGNSAKDALTQELKQLGVEPVVLQSIDNDQSAAASLERFAQSAKTAGADLIASYVGGAGMFASPVALAKDLRQNGVQAVWIGSPTTTSTDALKRAGADLNGAYAVTDFAPKASPVAEAFAQRYRATYNVAADQFSAWAFDAMNVLAKAIASAGSTDPNKIRTAILAIRGYAGAEGPYNFDPNGDGLHGYNVVHNDNGNWVFVKHVEFSFQE